MISLFVHLIAASKWLVLYFLTEHNYARNTVKLDVIGYTIGLTISGLFLLGSIWRKSLLYLPFLVYNVRILVD